MNVYKLNFSLPHMFEHKHLTSMVTARFITFDTKISTEHLWEEKQEK